MVTSKDAVCNILREIKDIASKLGMKIISDDKTSLIIHPHPNSESINLEFKQWKEVKNIKEWDYCKDTMLDYEKVLHDNDFVCSSFTKTQYAGYRVHVLVAEILRKIAGRCTLVYVSDEADYYETRSIEKTAESFDESSAMISMVTGRLKEVFGSENVYCAMDHTE